MSGAAVGSVILGLAAVALFATGWRRWRRSVRLADTPTVPPSAVPFGRVECSGRAAVPQGWSTVGRRPAVWYRFRLQEYHKDSDGDGEWRTRAEARSARQFLLVDDHGTVLVDPDGAIVDAITSEASDLGTLTLHVLAKATETVVAAAGVDPDRPIASLRGRWRVLEECLPVGTVVTALGPVLPASTDPSLPVFRRGESGPGGSGDLYLGHGSPDEVEARNRRGGLLVVLTPLPAGLAVGGLLSSRGVPFAVGLAFASLGYATAVVRWALDRYNRIVFTANQVEACWSMVDVALARRATLVPQLVAVVEAAFASEAAVQESMAISRWQHRERVDLVAADASGAVAATVFPRIAALAEQYPSLTTNSNALELQRQLADVERRIASARTVYNDAVALLLDRMQQFPSSLFAGRFRDRRSTYWKV